MASYIEALTKTRRLAASPIGGRPIRVALGGNCNSAFLEPGLKLALFERGFLPDIESLPMDSYASWVLAGGTADVVVLWISSFAASVGETSLPEFDADGLNAATSALAVRGAKIFVILPETLEAERDPWSPYVSWHRSLEQSVDTALSHEIVRLSPNGLQLSLGSNGWCAPRYWASARCPCHPDAATELGTLTGRAIAQSLRIAVKAIAVDLDNTLWGGIVGDDGAENLLLDPRSEGRPYLALQRFLLGLKQSGIVLAAISKNEPDAVDAVFAQRREMILKKDDFYDVFVSWDRKSVAISSFAETLGIGLDAVCLIDDSPHERAEALAALPDLIVPDLPLDPNLRVPFLAASGLFLLPMLSADDVARSKRYAEDKDRRRERGAAIDLQQYLQSLHMRLVARPIDRQSLARAAALVQKTNQFNLSTLRHQAAAVLDFSQRADGCAFGYELSDRFGELGMIGVILANARDESLFIDTWVLSCRAFGRGVEQAMFDHILTWGRAHGARTVIAHYLPTDRNKLVRELLLGLGFEASGRNDQFEYYHNDRARAPAHHLQIETNSEAERKTR